MRARRDEPPVGPHEFSFVFEVCFSNRVTGDSPERFSEISWMGVSDADEHAPPGRGRVAVGLLPRDGEGPEFCDRRPRPQRHLLGVVERADGDEDPGGVLQPRLVVAAVPDRCGKPVADSSIRQPELVLVSVAEPCAPGASDVPETTIAN